MNHIFKSMIYLCIVYDVNENSGSLHQIVIGAEAFNDMSTKMFDNVQNTVRDDLLNTITKGSKVSIAAACFSMYAYRELKAQLESIEECRFIFTSPTFIKDKGEK